MGIVIGVGLLIGGGALLWLIGIALAWAFAAGAREDGCE